jgi:hypothetical protein
MELRCSEQNRRKMVTQSFGATARQSSPCQPGRQRRRIDLAARLSLVTGRSMAEETRYAGVEP